MLCHRGLVPHEQQRDGREVRGLAARTEDRVATLILADVVAATSAKAAVGTLGVCGPRPQTLAEVLHDRSAQSGVNWPGATPH